MAMHPIDEAICDGRLTGAMLREHEALPLPAMGASYWGDHRRAGHDAEAAARLAARDMGATLRSLAALR